MTEEIQQMQRINALCAKYLLTHDMRYMFLKICFPYMVSQVALEGSPTIAGFKIAEKAKAHSRMDEMEAKLKQVFEQ